MTRVIDRDLGWREIIQSIDDIDLEVDVGFFDERNATVAFWNEFGTRTVPARPFMRSALDKNLGSMSALFRKRLGALVDGKTSAGAVENAVGAEMKNLIQREIQNWRNPPNDAETAQEKGVNRPLVDTGRMIKAVAYRSKGGASG